MKKWYLRTGDGKIFGPVDLDTLKEWVKDGRVEPFAGISYDLKNWALAALKPELEMDWVVENEPGRFFGPTHRAVVDDLKRQGAIAEGSRIYRDDHDGALLAEARSRVAEWKQAFEAQKASADAEARTRVATEAALQRAEAEAAAMRSAAADTKKALEQTKSDLEGALSELAETRALLDAARKEILFHKNQLDASRSECEAQRTTIASLKAAVDGIEKLQIQHRQEITEIRSAAERELEFRDGEIAELREQLLALTSPRKRHWESSVEPAAVIAEPPPPAAKTLFSDRNNSALAALERQAQNEIARMGAENFKKLFGR